MAGNFVLLGTLVIARVLVAGFINAELKVAMQITKQWNTGRSRARDSLQVLDPSATAPISSSGLQPSVEPPLIKVVYLFAGRKRHSDVAAFLKQAVRKPKAT